MNQRIGFLKQEEFNRPILRLNPKNFEDCLEIFCHRYPEPSGKQFRRFRWLVTEDSRFAPPCDLSVFNDLKRLLEEKKQDIKAEELKKKIFQDENENENEDENQLKMFPKRTLSIEDVDGMEGHEFESFLEKLFTEMGYYAEKTLVRGIKGQI